MFVREIAALLDAPFEGNGECDIRGVAPLEMARPAEISFVSNRKAAEAALSSAAGALIVPLEFPADPNHTLIRVRDPRVAAARVIERLHPKQESTPGVHATAVLGPGVVLGHNVSIGPHCAIGAAVHIGDGAVIGAGCAVGDYTRIGERTVLHANVTIYPNSTLGNRVVVHSGAVIGADGFGFVMRDGAWENFPQIGRVEIGDDVELGAHTCVDRAALGVTSIGAGTKIDNMVHIGHNCRIGRGVLIVAQTGLAGGVTVGDYAVIGGQVGIGDKARIESRAVLGSGAGVLTSKIVRGGQVMWGTPARPLKEHLEQLAALSRLPKILKEWQELKRRLASKADEVTPEKSE
jgi:UDP-3-O-[3-hydroxymyristoyl] glucosamine N-acyltransferase